MTADKLRHHEHAGVEFISVIQGTLSVDMNGEEHALEAGDAIHATVEPIDNPFGQKVLPVFNPSLQRSRLV